MAHPTRHQFINQYANSGRDSVSSIDVPGTYIVVLDAVAEKAICHDRRLSTANCGDELHRAIRQHDNETVEDLLSNSPRSLAETVEPGSCGKRPLHTAAEVDNLGAFQLLLNHRANPFGEQACCYGLQPIHVACIHGAVEVLTFLLDDSEDSQFDKGVMLSVPDRDGSLPLHWAVTQRQLECVKMLLERGASILIPQRRGLKATPLQLACNRKAVDVLRLMVQLAPVASLRSKDAGGHTALSMAVLMNADEIVSALVQKGAPLNVLDASGCNLAHLAASKGAWKVLPVLVNAGINPFSVDDEKRTIAHHAVLSSHDLAGCELFCEYTAQRPDWRTQLNLPDSTGFGALHYAVLSGSFSLVQGLTRLGTDVKMKSQKEMTALHFAARHGFHEIVTFLLSCKGGQSVLNARDYKGRTPLHIAAAHGHSDIVDILCSRGGIPIRDHSGQTPLHYAAAANDYQTLKTVVENYPEIINEVDHSEHTALHTAAIHDAGRAISYLLSSNASFNCGSCNPLDLAILHRKENAAMAFVTSPVWKAIIERPSSHFDSIVGGLVTNLPNVMRHCLDRSIQQHSKSDKNAVDNELYILYDFAILKPVQMIPHLEPLKIMARNKRKELLSHPLCTTLLEQKWIVYGLYMSAFILLANIAYVTLLSYVVIESVRYTLRPYLLNVSFNNLKNHTGPDVVNGSSYTELKMEVEEERRDFDRAPTWVIVLLLFAAIIILAKEIGDLVAQGRRYWRDWTNYMQLALFLSSLSFVICLSLDNTNNQVSNWTYESAAIAVFLAWFNLIRFFRPFGVFGIYSFIFFTILRTLIQVALFFFILTAAFTVTFFTLFPTYVFPNNDIFFSNPDNYEPEELRTSHEKLETSAIRIASLMLGDLEAFERFLSPYTEDMLPFKELSFIFYGLCLIIMSILLNNLLMGLSLADMATIRQNAVILRLQMQLSLHDSLERGLFMFPKSWIENIQRRTEEYRYYPGRPVDFKTWLARLVSGGYNRVSIVSENVDFFEESRQRAESNNDDLKQILNRMKEMDGNLENIRQLMAQMQNGIRLGDAENITNV